MKQTPYNLKSSVCLACTSCHDKKDTILPFCYSIDSTIYGIALIISWRKYILTSAERLLNDSQFLLIKSIATVSLAFISFDKFFFCRKLIHGKSAFFPC